MRCKRAGTPAEREGWLSIEEVEARLVLTVNKLIISPEAARDLEGITAVHRHGVEKQGFGASRGSRHYGRAAHFARYADAGPSVEALTGLCHRPSDAGLRVLYRAVSRPGSSGFCRQNSKRQQDYVHVLLAITYRCKMTVWEKENEFFIRRKRGVRVAGLRVLHTKESPFLCQTERRRI
jgi:hypothetical protein